MKIHTFLVGIANVHLVPTARGVIVVDTGYSFPGFTNLLLSNLAREGYQTRDVKLILLTHGHVDHAGNAAALKRITGAPIAIHRNDGDMVIKGWHRCPPGRNSRGKVSSWILNRVPWAYHFPKAMPDVWLEEGQGLADFGLEGYVIETPGHSAGSVSLVLEDGHMVIGDALLYRGGVHYPMFWENETQARASAERIASFKSQWLHTGHGVSFSREELERFLERENGKL